MTETTDPQASMDRALIFEANERGYTAEQVTALLDYSGKYGPEVMSHPSFPLGILVSFEDTAAFKDGSVD